MRIAWKSYEAKASRTQIKLSRVWGPNNYFSTFILSYCIFILLLPAFGKLLWFVWWDWQFACWLNNLCLILSSYTVILHLLALICERSHYAAFSYLYLHFIIKNPKISFSSYFICHNHALALWIVLSYHFYSLCEKSSFFT